MGDWNAYATESASHMRTLLTGTIADEQQFGRGESIDADGAPLRDARPLHNATGPETYTWRGSEDGPFPPGELDRVLFTGSVLEMVGGFVLNTVALPPEVLSRVGLSRDDVLRVATPTRVYDHLPVVVDFRPR